MKTSVRTVCNITRGAGLLCVFLVAGLSACSRTEPPHVPSDEGLVLKLRWIKSYPDQSKPKVNTGLFWALSFLGAKLPAEADIISWDGTMVTLDLGAARIPQASQESWRKLVQVLKSSDEYRTMGGIDIGRFVFLSLCSSHQYYALTGAPSVYAEFRARHTFAPKQVAIVESGVARGNRLIEVGTGKGFESIAFVAFEGIGSLREGTFQTTDVETLDFMENGQLRFALYDREGHLKPATTPTLTAAGKPSKCLWCHEINLQPPFRNVTDLPGYYSTKEFRDFLASATRTVANYRRGLASKVDFTALQDHSNAEHLYLSFAEPTAGRLAAEWNIPLDRVRQLLASHHLKTHPHSERIDDDILGDDLYDRNEVDSLAPYATIRGPSDMREASTYEPDVLH